LAKNSIVINTNNSAAGLRPDASKFGGKPFLPASFEWPEYADPDEGVIRPLTFFCQINLAEAAPFDRDGLLPKTGILSFFYEWQSYSWGMDAEQQKAAKVFYFENTDGFVSAELPDSENNVPELAITFSSKLSYPTSDEFDLYSQVDCDFEELDEHLKVLGVDPEAEPDEHKLLGYAYVIQNEMVTECEALYCEMHGEAYEEPEDLSEANIQSHQKQSEWILLLQLGTISQDDLFIMFGDSGMLYFYIRKEDLAARRFDKVLFSLQCY